MDNRITHTTPIKQTGLGIFLVVVFFLMVFPFINTFNQFLVNIIEPFLLSNFNTKILIPYEAQLVKLFLKFLSVPVAYSTQDSGIITLIGKTGGLDPIAIAWNCLGWQSMVLVVASLIVGIRGNFSLASKIEMIIIGILGTFWINIFRLTLIFYLYYHYNREVALFVHDWGGMALTIIWMFVFWWFAFRFVLQPNTRIWTNIF